MKTIDHVGTVVGTRGGEAMVEIQVPRECAERGSCACGAAFRSGVRTVRVPRSDLSKGDRVRVSVPVTAGYLSILFVFVLPLALTVVGFLVGSQFESGEGAHDIATILGGACGFALAIAIAIVANRLMRSSGELKVERIQRAEA